MNKKPKIKNWNLSKVIGYGGHSQVWEAQNRDFKNCVIKVLKNKDLHQEKLLKRFKNEIQIQKKLEEFRIVLPIYDDNATDESTNDGIAWFAMPKALTLSKYEFKTFSDIVEKMHEIAKALNIMHSQNFSHRDIKPENIFLYKGNIVLGDFGIAHIESEKRLTLKHEKVGPAYYIAPEMLNDSYNSDGKTADIYSLGKLFWKIVSGYKFPLPGNHRCNIPAMTLSFYSDDSRSYLLDGLIDRCTSLNPDERPNANEFADELSFWLNPRYIVMNSIEIPVFTDIKKRILDINEANNEDSKLERDCIQFFGDTFRSELESLATDYASQTDLHYTHASSGLHPLQQHPKYKLEKIRDQIGRQGAGFCLMLQGDRSQERVHFEFCASQIGDKIFSAVQLAVCNDGIATPKCIEIFWQDFTTVEVNKLKIEDKITEYKNQIIIFMPIAIIRLRERLDSKYNKDLK